MRQALVGLILNDSEQFHSDRSQRESFLQIIISRTNEDVYSRFAFGFLNAESFHVFSRRKSWAEALVM